MNRSPLENLSWLCLLLQFAGVALAYGHVLCVASDGHVVLELTHRGPCETEARRHHEHDAAGAMGECADHPCTDIALSQPAWPRASRTIDERAASQVRLASPPRNARAEAAVGALTRHILVMVSHEEHGLRARRSVVLLI